MAVSKTTRLGLTRWTDDNDPWSRDDWDDDNAQLEALAAKAEQGNTAGRPAAGQARRLYYDTTLDILYYDNGVAWLPIYDKAAPVGVTNGTNVVATNTFCFRRGLFSLVSVNASIGGAISAGATLFTLPVGHRPPTGTAPQILISNGAPATGSVNDAGQVTLVTALSNGQSLRGQFLVPL